MVARREAKSSGALLARVALVRADVIALRRLIAKAANRAVRSNHRACRRKRRANAARSTGA
ncbi:hypothetical protein BURKHO8Y_170119 [Burkholderia sp. 8Y]|nr:hypothetical protein BURKHO8Y_170119 [Burkholderia sp. 8Y]